MNQRSNSKTSLFLMELIVAVFFFSLSAAVCVRLFVDAHLLAQKTVNLNNALTWSQSLAESFTGEKGNLEKIGKLYPSAFVTEKSLILFFDKDWKIISDDLSSASYEAILNVETKAASEVYSDVTDYDVPLIGNAIVGNITVVDVKDIAENITEFPEDDSMTILQNSVDVYIGKEAADE